MALADSTPFTTGLFPNGDAALERHLAALIAGMLAHTMDTPGRLRALLRAAENLTDDGRTALDTAWRAHAGICECPTDLCRHYKTRDTWTVAAGFARSYRRGYPALAEVAEPILEQLKAIHPAAYAAGLYIVGDILAEEILARPWLETGLPIPAIQNADTNKKEN